MARPVYSTPDSHGLNAMGSSSAHSKLAPGWFASKVNFALVLSVCALGPDRIVVSGAGVTLQLRLAGVGSTLPAASVARTRSWCTPTDRLPVGARGGEG